MVNEAVVKETIQRMLDSGIDEGTILSTLKDIGIDDATSRRLISEQKDAPEAEVPVEGADDDDDIKTMRAELETQSQIKDLHDTTTHNMLNDHAQRIDDVGRKIDEVRSAMSSSSIGSNLESHSRKLGNVSDRLDEIDAKVTALMDIMKKILEANRNILSEIENQK